MKEYTNYTIMVEKQQLKELKKWLKIKKQSLGTKLIYKELIIGGMKYIDDKYKEL